MRRTLLSFFVGLVLHGSSQQYLWARGYPLLYGDSGLGISAISTDTLGNLYIAGNLSRTVNINGDTLSTSINPATSFYNVIPYIAKINPSSKAEWAYLYNRDYENSINDICVDPSGNVYAAAQFEQDMVTQSNTYVTVSIGCDVFEMTSTGNSGPVFFLNGSVVPWPADWDPVLKKIALQDNYIYVAGYTTGAMLIGNTPLSQDSNKNGAFIAKYNLNTHQFEWGKFVTGTTSVSEITGLKADHNGNVYISGTLGLSPNNEYFPSDSSYFDNTIIVTSGISQGFVAKLNAQGQYVWVKTYGTQNSDASCGIAMDNEDNIYYSGIYNFSYDSFPSILTKLNPGGQELWRKEFFQTYWLAMGGAGNDIYIAGDNRSHTALNLNDTIINNVRSVYIMRFDTNGNFVWCAPFGKNGIGVTSISELAAAASGQLYLNGDFYGICDVGNSELIINNFGETDDESTLLAMLYNGQGQTTNASSFRGRIYFDNNNNCTYDSTDIPAKYYGVVATPGNYVAFSDSNGFYNLTVPPGTYTLKEILPEEDIGQLWQTCPISLQYDSEPLAIGAIDSGLDFANEKYSCSYTTIGFNSDNFIPCYQQFNIPVEICNYNNQSIDSNVIRVAISDSLTVSASTPSFDYFDSAAHEYVFSNVFVAADSCSQLIFLCIYNCTYGDFNSWPPPTFTCISRDSISGNCQGVNMGIYIDTTTLTLNEDPGAIKIPKESLEFSAFPNPFHDEINIHLSDIDDGVLSLYDVAGRLIEAHEVKNTSDVTLYLTNISGGIYILKYTNTNHSTSRLLVRQ